MAKKNEVFRVDPKHFYVVYTNDIAMSKHKNYKSAEKEAIKLTRNLNQEVIILTTFWGFSIKNDLPF